MPKEQNENLLFAINIPPLIYKHSLGREFWNLGACREILFRILILLWLCAEATWWVGMPIRLYFVGRKTWTIYNDKPERIGTAKNWSLDCYRNKYIVNKILSKFCNDEKQLHRAKLNFCSPNLPLFSQIFTQFIDCGIFSEDWEPAARTPKLDVK